MKELDYLIREYQLGDEEKIIDLFQTVFKKELNLEFWKWRFSECPFGKGIIYLAFENKNLVGHYAVHPVDLLVENKLVKAVFSMTTMVHPLHHRRGLFSQLASSTYEKASSLGYRIVYGFPNRNSYHGFVNNLGWKDMSKMNILHVKNMSLEDLSSNLECHRIFDSTTIDDLTSNLDKNYVVVPRTRDFIQWRFFSKPSDIYYVYKITKDDNCVAYLVLKKYGTTAHVIDLLGTCNDDVVKTTLSIIHDFCKKEGLSEITCWLNETSDFYKLFLKYGFNTSESETYFGFKNFNSNDDVLSSLVSKNGWYLTMADSDVY